MLGLVLFLILVCSALYVSISSRPGVLTMRRQLIYLAVLASMVFVLLVVSMVVVQGKT